MVIADSYKMATIIFTDIVGFTKMSSTLPPEELVTFLNKFFVMIDEMVEDRGLEKIKTIGDCYMVVSGIPSNAENHAQNAVEFALDLVESVSEYTLGGNPIQVRVGIHSGPVVAGVIGKTKLTYDVWGDTVNKASRMESTGLPGKIQISDETAKCLKDNPEYKLEGRGSVAVKGLGEVPTYWISRNTEPPVVPPEEPVVKPQHGSNRNLQIPIPAPKQEEITTLGKGKRDASPKPSPKPSIGSRKLSSESNTLPPLKKN